MKTKPEVAEATKQVEKFGLIGIMNTLIDYVLFISITKVFSIPLDQAWIAKIPSGAVAMVNSFYFNKTWVFKHKKGDVREQGAKFLVSTLIGVFVIQTGLVRFFTSEYTFFGEVAFEIAQSIGVTSLLPAVITYAFVIKTVAFGLATIASMTWNFVVYKYWAFRR